MTAFPTHPRRPTRKEVERALADIDFPLEKEQLVQCVESAPTNAEGDGAVVDQLRTLPLATYESADDVLRSVELADQLGR